MSLGILVFIASLFLIVTVGAAEATLNNVVGVYLSDTCITLVKNNLTSTCPSYDDLLQLDTSNTFYAGGFITENGYTYRDRSFIKNPWIIHEENSDFVVYVDPPRGMHSRIKTIEIHPNFDVYIDRSDSQIDDYMIKQYHDRYVNPGCTKSTINADIWPELVADTIFLMRNGCDAKFTSFNHTAYIPLELTQHDISTSQKWIHDKWVAEVKQFCIYKFRECTE